MVMVMATAISITVRRSLKGREGKVCSVRTLMFECVCLYVCVFACVCVCVRASCVRRACVRVFMDVDARVCRTSLVSMPLILKLGLSC